LIELDLEAVASENLSHIFFKRETSWAKFSHASLKIKNQRGAGRFPVQLIFNFSENFGGGDAGISRFFDIFG